MKQGTSGPAGRLAALYASLLLKVLVGIPGNSAPGTTHLLPTSEERERKRKARQKGGARPTRRVTPPCHSAQLTELHCRFHAVSPCPCPCPVWAPASSHATHCLVNGADRGDWFVASKDKSGGSCEPRGRGASNDVLGARRRTEGRSGEPEAATSHYLWSEAGG